jgi:hypothetical protein
MTVNPSVSCKNEYWKSAKTAARSTRCTLFTADYELPVFADEMESAEELA